MEAMSKTDFLVPTPDTIAATRQHLIDWHTYPNRTSLQDEMSDWEVMENHAWEHMNAGRHSAPNHTHDRNYT